MKFKSLDSLLDNCKVVPLYRERKVKDFNFLPPISVELHWTSSCNYDCLHCSYGSRRRSINYLRPEIVECLVQDLIEMRCKAVYLSGGGEPTVLKNWDKYAEKLMDNDVEVALITNGVAIQEKHFSVIRRMNYVAVSVYSTYESNYIKITEGNAFSEQFSFSEKIKSENIDVVIGARCVLNQFNFDEMVEIYEKSIGSGFDYIIFIPAVDYEGRGVFLEDSYIDSVNNIIEENMDKFDLDRTNVLSLLEKKYSITNKKIIEKYYLSNLQAVEQCRREPVLLLIMMGVFICVNRILVTWN